MGGAERAERKRRQHAAEAAARGGQPENAPAGERGRIVTAATAVLVLVAAVVGVGVWLQQRADPGELPAAIPVATLTTDYRVELQGETVVAGNPGAPVTIEVYEDFLCPGCGALESRYGDRLAEAAASGQAVVHYHPIALLDEDSEPEGYSTLAAGAALCAAEAGVFPAVHESLFATQPAREHRAWSATQIAALGRRLGAGDDFARCVRAESSEQRVAAATRRAAERIATLRGDGRYGTPTVLVDGEIVDVGDREWLARALGVGH